jgi:hypothetical protein
MNAASPQFNDPCHESFPYPAANRSWDDELTSTFRGHLGLSVVSAETPVLILFNDSRTAEFETVASAKAWLEKARRIQRAEADAARIYICESGQWESSGSEGLTHDPAGDAQTLR